MVNFLTEEEPNAEKEIWTTAATMFRSIVNTMILVYLYLHLFLFLDVKSVVNS